MFKKENRLVSTVRFNNSFSLSVPQFILKRKTNGLGLNRFGIVISKKVDKKAVVRNKIKRFFRHALNSANKKMIQGNDILFIVRPEIASKTEDENSKAIASALGEAQLIK